MRTHKPSVMLGDLLHVNVPVKTKIREATMVFWITINPSNFLGTSKVPDLLVTTFLDL